MNAATVREDARRSPFHSRSWGRPGTGAPPRPAAHRAVQATTDHAVTTGAVVDLRLGEDYTRLDQRRVPDTVVGLELLGAKCLDARDGRRQIARGPNGFDPGM